MLPDLTYRFDVADPLAQFDPDYVWSGFKCVDGQPTNQRAHSSAETFVAEDGGLRFTLWPDGWTVNECGKRLRSMILPYGGTPAVMPEPEGEGTEACYGWSVRFPEGGLPDTWAVPPLDFTGSHVTHPAYSMLYSRLGGGTISLDISTGKKAYPGPDGKPVGSAGWNPIGPPNGNGYLAQPKLVGPGSPIPTLPRDTWLDFMLDIEWRGRTNGRMEMYYRERGAGDFRLLYSNQPESGALIQAPPHPTMHWNEKYGSPGEGTSEPLHLAWNLYAPPPLGSAFKMWLGCWHRRSSVAEIRALLDPPQSGLVLTPLTAEDADPFVLGHDPVVGAVGFRLRDSTMAVGKWSHTWDGSRTSHKFAPGRGPYRVQALAVLDEGEWP